MLEDLRNYIIDHDFVLNISKNTLDIVNYQTIQHLDNHLIIVRSKDSLVKIAGKKLVVKKLLEDEILIQGEIASIQLGEQDAGD